MRISRRLSGIYGALIAAVLLGGGISLYLALLNFFSFTTIGKEAQQVDLVDQMHYTLHHFVSDLQRARLRGGGLPDAQGATYVEQLSAYFQRYKTAEPAETEDIGELRDTLSALALLSEKIVQGAGSVGDLPSGIHTADVLALEQAEQRVQSLAHRLRMTHRTRIQAMARDVRRRVLVIAGAYAGFLVLGSVFALGLGRFFSRTIARPLRVLAEAASEVAHGRLNKKVPVASRDEIGQLSHAFNVMVQRLKDDEERLKGMVRLEEREMLAHEIHDTLAQDLALLLAKLGEAERNLGPDGQRATQQVLSEMRRIVELAYGEVRHAIFGLRTMVSKGLGLVPTLTEYLHDFSEMRGIAVDLKIDEGEEIRFSPWVETQLIRIIHEALTNTTKHSGAKTSTIELERTDGIVRVVIADDGAGFAAGDVAERGRHFGLKTMKERAENVGGNLRVESAPGEGTRVTVTLPATEGSR